MLYAHQSMPSGVPLSASSISGLPDAPVWRVVSGLGRPEAECKKEAGPAACWDSKAGPLWVGIELKT